MQDNSMFIKKSEKNLENLKILSLTAKHGGFPGFHSRLRFHGRQGGDIE